MSFQKKAYRFTSPSAMTKFWLSKTTCFPTSVGTVAANLVALKFATPYLLLCRSFHILIRYLSFDFFSCAGSSLLLKLSVVAKSGAALHCGAWSSRCSGFSCWEAQALGVSDAVVAARGPSSCDPWAYLLCGMGIFLGIEQCPLHWQADCHPLHHQESPVLQLNSYLCLLHIFFSPGFLFS